MILSKHLARHAVWGCLIFLLLFFTHPLSSWPATVEWHPIPSQNQYAVGGSYPINFIIRISSPWYIHGTGEKETGLIPTSLTFSGSPWVRIDEIRFPTPEKKRFVYTNERVSVFSGEILVRGRLTVFGEAPTGKHTITGMLSYQACSSESCMPPENLPVAFSVSVAPYETTATPENHVMPGLGDAGNDFHEIFAGRQKGAGLWLTLLAIFLGGLALNLTPCVYPLIPITVSYFGGMRSERGGKTFIHGSLYMAGLALTNSLLGLTASLSGGMLGGILQNPLVLIAVAGVLVFLALSFFGFWELQLPSGIIRLASKNFGGYFGSFFMGLTLGIVAAPCLGPFILGLLTYVAQQGDPLLGFLYFLTLSIGLGLPLFVLAVFSSTLEKLPVSGEWMVWVRKLLGWVLVGMAGYMLLPLLPYPFYRTLLFASILGTAGLHLGWFDRTKGISGTFRHAKRGFGLILLGTAVLLLLLFNHSLSREGVKWIPFDLSGLTEADKADRPVILDFFADWCGPCRAMDKKVFSNPEIAELSKNFVTMRVDLTRRSPFQKSLQKRFEVKGVPTVIFINKHGLEERSLRIESFVSREEMLNRMRKLREISDAPSPNMLPKDHRF